MVWIRSEERFEKRSKSMMKTSEGFKIRMVRI